MNFILPVKKLVLSERTGEWCKLPYPRHPHGCPNYDKDNKRHVCPPTAPKLEEYFDIFKPLYLVYSEFDVAKHAQEMHDKHPEWSTAQCRNLLYWQKSSRAQLRARMLIAMYKCGTDVYTIVPEAMGLNVYVTARLSGLRLERIRDLKTCHHVALIGHAKVKGD